MKGLYKKISVGVLALALVLGGSLSQGAMAYANSNQHKCEYQKQSMRPRSEFDFLDEYDREFNKEYLNEEKDKKNGKYILLMDYADDVSKSPSKRYYDDLGDFISCIYGHDQELNGIMPIVIGRNSFILDFK